MINQKKYTEEVLFNHYMVSGRDEASVHSQIPFFIETNIYDDIKNFSEKINALSIKILENINGVHSPLKDYLDPFPYKDEILSLSCPLSPMFWTRFDTFIDKNNKVSFSEFNYDKPCGQKEMHLVSKLSFKNNANKDFYSEQILSFMEISKLFNGEKINVGILVDPCHYEELHHAYYFKDILKDTNINIIQVGPKNLTVSENKVYAFKQYKLDALLKLFPTEFSNEVLNFNEILNSFNSGNIILLNDPRIIAIQCKGFFSYLWKLVKEDSPLLLEDEKEIIKTCLPYTVEFSKENINSYIENKDNIVIKSSLGRYSEEVYIGRLFSKEKWEDKLNLLLASPKKHIVQDLIHIREEYTFKPSENNMNIPLLAYGNFGVYLSYKKAIGILVRWSLDLLTSDDTTWMSPIGYKEPPIYFNELELSLKDRKKLMLSINEKASFNFNLTSTHTNVSEYINPTPFIINEDLYKEMLLISKKFLSILDKTRGKIKDNLEIFSEPLAIPKNLIPLIKSSNEECLCALGRIDFALDIEDNLKILEFNSETPSGIVEAIYISELIKSELSLPYKTGNENLKNIIKENFSRIIQTHCSCDKIVNIGVLTSWYDEDIFTSKLLLEILEEIPNTKVFLGNIHDISSKGDKLSIYGVELDFIYRHYPLDWLSFEPLYSKVAKKLLLGQTKLINPPHTLITQSKTYFSILHELVGKGILEKEEEDFILKYIPYSTLMPNKNLSDDCLVKPILSREGDGIKFSFEGIEKGLKNMIFQERVNINPYKINIYDSLGSKSRYIFPVIGIYINNTTPYGVFTRIGDMVTDFNAMFVPTFIK